MPKKRLSMRRVRDVLRLKQLGLSNRQIASSVKVSHSTVADYLARAEKADIAWPIPVSIDDTTLRDMFFGDETPRESLRIEPDYSYLHKELKKKGVTLMLLWEEYTQKHANGYRYSQFCNRYRAWEGHIEPSMRQTHKAGEKCFVDYAGMTMPMIDRDTGEIKECQIFVAALGASSYTFAEATATQALPDFIGSHVRAFAFFGGVPEIITPDNLKGGVSKACYYDPDINPTYQDMAVHYGVAIIPTRPASPKDKAKAESAVQVVERRILACLRDRTFFCLAELNEAIRPLLKDLNERPFQKLDGSRRQLFEELDSTALRPLPAYPYEFATWKKAKVSIDYHIEVDRHYYSVPYRLIGKKVDVRLTERLIEVICDTRRVASHMRSAKRGSHTTIKEHMPSSHQRHLEWTPSKIIDWARQTGEETGKLVQKIIESKPHPEQGYRSCLGIIRLSDRYGAKRVEAAAKRALLTGAIRYRSVKSILVSGLDRIPVEESPPAAILYHENLRGNGYYRQGERL